jgi:hypothetical protein
MPQSQPRPAVALWLPLADQSVGYSLNARPGMALNVPSAQSCLQGSKSIQCCRLLGPTAPSPRTPTDRAMADARAQQSAVGGGGKGGWEGGGALQRLLPPCPTDTRRAAPARTWRPAAPPVVSAAPRLPASAAQGLCAAAGWPQPRPGQRPARRPAPAAQHPPIKLRACWCARPRGGRAAPRPPASAARRPWRPTDPRPLLSIQRPARRVRR